jgi:NADPH:quinone reductase-like Zn-dependent oxidoreductase
MAAIPETYQAFRRGPGIGTLSAPLRLERSTETTLPAGGLGAHDVLIKIHAVSLNYRDVLMLRGTYPGAVLPGGVVASDCSAEVVVVGDEVTRFRVGDRVTPNFDLGNLTGEIAATGHLTVGGEVDGVLREYAVYEEGVLVHLPKHLSWEEVSGSRRGH